MSIRLRIIALEGVDLWRFEPPKLLLKRRLYLTATGRKYLIDPDSATNILRLRGFIQSAMVHWVSGGRVRADVNRKGRFLKRLDPPPPEIWEIRVTDPVPQVRLLGRIVEPDTFIVHRIHTRKYLGDKGGQGWTEAMNACVSEFDRLFPGEPLFQRNSIYDYVTENCDDVAI